ncbi:MAG: UDP-N-acetylmuramoyl-L-alanyl-D-glutamate--2,6-diaminopimelate ligase [Candidatus Omnitrophota bacterium]
MTDLKSLLKGIEYTAEADINGITVNNIAVDSRVVAKRDLFIAIKGNAADGHLYVKDALARGASAVILERDMETGSAAKIIVKDARVASAAAAVNFYRDPSKEVKVIGVTGTNGKTTVTYILERILNKAGLLAGVIGTIMCKIGDEVIESGNTTPSPITLQGFLRRMADLSIDYCVMEVSSHALDQLRTYGIDFRAAVFTNATHEHLDYHKTFKNYLNAKRSLFEGLNRERAAIINRDDPNFEEIKSGCSCNTVISYGMTSEADIYADRATLDIGGSTFNLHVDGNAVSVRSRLIGTHNIYNMLAAASCAWAEGINIDTIKEGLEGVDGVPGRLEMLESGGVKIFVDYAHTDDALENVLKALYPLKRGRLITVFGCGGNRDRGKRPKMGAIAAEFSDHVVVTSDNPRHEDPGGIIKEIVDGISPDYKAISVAEDRREAIREALSLAREGDIVLLAGKGHEKYQIVKDRKISFSDMETAAELLRARRDA